MCRVSRGSSGLCWPIDILIITFILHRQASNQWKLPSPSISTSTGGLCRAALLRYIKTAAPWSNKQIPPGSAEGYPTSVNNAAFKHQSYAKWLVHRGGDGQQEKAEKQGLDRRDNERRSTQTDISIHLMQRCLPPLWGKYNTWRAIYITTWMS